MTPDKPYDQDKEAEGDPQPRADIKASTQGEPDDDVREAFAGEDVDSEGGKAS